MKLARLFLTAVAASTLAACTADSLTAPTAPPSRTAADTTECPDCTATDTVFLDDGAVPAVGSGG